MARLDPSLKHAITPPFFDANKVHRERLVDAIHGEIGRKLIVIAAPAGYGKTTLLSDFAAHTEMPVCWVGLTEADRDVMRMATVFLASLEKRFRRLKNSLDLRAYANSPPEALAQAFGGLISQNIDEAFAILVDEADVLNSSEDGIAFLDALLGGTTDQVCVIAAGREVLEVSLARLMAEGTLAGFGPHDLALDNEELAELARVAYGEDLTDREISQVQEETKGWITGVIMSGVLGGRSLRAIGAQSRPMVYEYLASVVLNRQPEDLRRFMLDSSVLPVMSEQSCQAALDSLDAHRHLERLVADGLFVTVSGGDPPSYEYHPLFRKFLLETRRVSDPDTYLELCGRVAAYLEEQGEIEQAVQVYVMAGDSDRGMQIAEAHAEDLYDEGRSSTLAEWANLFNVVDHANSRIRILVAINHVESGGFNDAERLLTGLFGEAGEVASKETLARAGILLGIMEYAKGEDDLALEWITKAEKLNKSSNLNAVAIDCLRFRSLIQMRSGRLDDALDLADQAVGLLEEGAGDYLAAMTYSTQMSVLVAAGKLLEARDAGLKSVEIVSLLGAPMPAARALNNLATIEHAGGHFELALNHYARSLEKAKLAGSEPFQALVYQGQADLFSDIGLVRQSAELYAEAIDILARGNNLEWAINVCVRTAILHRRNGGIQTAKEWLERAIDLSGAQSDMPKIRIQIAALELLAKPVNARGTLQRVLGDERLAPAERVLAKYHLAKAELLTGNEDGARRDFEDALQEASALQLVQDIAAELLSDREMREFALDAFRSSATWELVEARIETMHSMARFYAGDQEQVPLSAKGVQLQALGRSTILVKGEEIQNLKPQVKEFLFFLVDQGGAERERLAQTFWPDFGSGRQTANIHMAVYSLRNALGKDFISLDGVAYSISTEVDLAYDVREFVRTAKVAQELPVGDPRRLFAFTEAIRQYQGPFLLESESDWVVERRRYLEMVYLDLVSQHADEALMRDQPLRAVQLLQDALVVDPYRDDLNLRYILLLGRLNRRSEIVSHYQRYVTLLSSDLGLDPSEEVRDAYARMIS